MASSHRQGECRGGGGWAGWPGATLGCFWVQMEGEWKGAGPAPPPRPLPALLSLQTSRGSARPQRLPSLGWFPYAQGPLGVKVGGSSLAGAPFRTSCFSQHLSAVIFAQSPRMDRESAPSSGWERGEWNRTSIAELRGTWVPVCVPILWPPVSYLSFSEPLSPYLCEYSIVSNSLRPHGL